jgi:hypothetical protein
VQAAHCQGVQKAGVQVHSVQDEAAIQGYFTIMKDQIRKEDQVSSKAFLEKEEVLSRIK